MNKSQALHYDPCRRDRTRLGVHGIFACSEVFRLVSTNQPRANRQLDRQWTGDRRSPKMGSACTLPRTGRAVSAGKTSMSRSARPATTSGVRQLIWDRLSIRASNEMVPAFSRDGHLMFFASNRLEGSFGGVDIWVSRREHTHDDFAWQPAENLGAGVNSSSLDAGPSYFENDEVGVPQLYFTVVGFWRSWEHLRQRASG